MIDNTEFHSTIHGVVFSAVGGLSTTLTLTTQLNHTHHFFYLDLPFWFIMLLMFLLIVLGAFLNAITENIQGIASRLKRFVVSVIVGILISFIIFPAIQEEPDIGGLLVLSFLGSFMGTGIALMSMRVISEILHDVQFTKSISKSIKDVLQSRVHAFLTLLFGEPK